MRVCEGLYTDPDPCARVPTVLGALAQATGCHAALVLRDGTFVPADARPAALDRRLEAALRTAVRRGRVVRITTGEQEPVQIPHHGRARSIALIPLATDVDRSGALVLAGEVADAVDDDTVAIGEHVATCLLLAVVGGRLRESLTEAQEVSASGTQRGGPLPVSGETRTVLAAALAALDLLRSGEGLSRRQRWQLVAALERGSRHLEWLVRQLLDSLLVESGQPLPVDARQTLIGDVLEAVAERFEQLAAIRVDVPAGLPPALIDANRLEQAIANLVAGSVRLPSGTEEVALTARRAGDTLTLGIRVPQSGAAAGEERSAAPAGLRPSLRLARSLIEAMGGRLEGGATASGWQYTVTVPHVPVVVVDGG